MNPLRLFVSFAAMAGLVGFGTSTFAATNSLDSVEYSDLQDQILVKATFHGPISQAPQSFSVSNPPRISFDFPNTENGTGKTLFEVNSGVLRSINVVQGEARTRLIVNLAAANPLAPRIEGNSFYISLPKSGLVAQAVPKTSMASFVANMDRPTSASNRSTINAVDFRTSSMDLATLRIDMSDPNVLIDAKQLPEGIVLSLPASNATEKLLKKLDVRDFGTPVESVTVRNVGQGSQIVFTNRGDWDFNVRQLDAQIYIDVRRKVVNPNSLADAKELQGKVVSFNFSQPVPVSQMIGIFQDITGMNFIVMPGVSGEIQSLKMENVPVDEAISVISRMYSLGFRRYGKTVVVGRADDLVKYDKEESERLEQRLAVEEIVQETFKVKYRLATEVLDALKAAVNTNQSASQSTGSGSATIQQAPGQASATSSGTSTNLFLSKRGSISVDPATNTIFVEETKSQLVKIRQRIEALDRPVKQVMIEARIVEASNTFYSALGIKLGGSLQYQIGNTKDALTFGSQTSALNMPGSTGTLNFSLFNSAKTNILNLEINAAEGDSKVKQLANPKVMTRDTKSAKIKFGTKIAGFSQATAGQTPTVTYTDAVTLLDVKPQIQIDGKIQMEIIVKNDSPATNQKDINNRELTTNVIVENGGTIVIGGMYAQTDTGGTDRIPILGDLPYVGWLFKQKSQKKEQTELLVFITPRIISEELSLQ